jgi:hypothetical protein
VKIAVVSPGGLTEPEINSAAVMLAGLVAGGAALGWVDPPSPAEGHGVGRRIMTELIGAARWDKLLYVLDLTR